MNTEKKDGPGALDQSDRIPAAQPGDDLRSASFERLLSPQVRALSADPDRLLGMSWEDKHAELLMLTKELRRLHATQLLLAANALELAIEHPGEPDLPLLVDKIRALAARTGGTK